MQTDGAKPMKAGYGKAGKQKTLSNFPTATTTTNYNYLWDTDSEGKVTFRNHAVTILMLALWGFGRSSRTPDLNPTGTVCESIGPSAFGYG